MKPAIDRTAAAVLLVVCAPLLAAIALAVRATLSSPVLFFQMRPGKCGRLFSMCKFRTMTDACDANGNPLSDGERLTRFGRWLRSTSLDELPELWNVLRGEMSLVGPRPLLKEYLELYTSDQARRHEVKPGLTGLAQVNGRNAISWDQKFTYDTQYVDRVSFSLDFFILCKTMVRVVRRTGISPQSHSTMPFFAGTERSERHGPSKAA